MAAKQKFTFTIHSATLNSGPAEIPTLYKLQITLLSDKDETIEVITKQIGFRNIEIKNSQLLVNGKPVYIKGVKQARNRPSYQQVISHERMCRILEK
jgi:beta-galactosidase